MSEEQKNTDPQEQADAEQESSSALEDGESVLSEEELDALQNSESDTTTGQDECLAYDFRDPARILQELAT